MTSENAKKPGWVISAGVLGLAMACMGIVSGTVSATLPGLIKAQKNIIPAMMSEAVKEKIKENEKTNAKEPMGVTSTAKIEENIDSFFKKSATYPAWFEKYTLYAGLAAILISLLCLAGSIMLLTGANAAKPVFCAAFLISSLFAIANTVISWPTGMMIISVAVIGSAMAVIVNIVLVYVVITGKNA
jgi:hypothetical protein